MGAFDSGDTFDYSAALGRALDANVSVLLFYGKNDLACNYVGAYAVATSLPWSGATAFASSPLLPLASGNALGASGEQQRYRPANMTAGGLSWVQIAASGHMAPLDEPPATAAALATLLAEI